MEGKYERAYSYPSYISIGGDSLDSLDTNWTYARDEQQGGADTFSETLDTGNSMVVARRQEPVKKTKKNSSVQRKRPSVEPTSNTPKNVKKKKKEISKKEQVAAEKEIRRRSTNSMRLRRLAPGGKVCPDEGTEMTEADRLVDAIQRSKLETNIAQVNAGMKAKSQSTARRNNNNWKNIDRVRGRFVKTKNKSNKKRGNPNKWDAMQRVRKAKLASNSKNPNSPQATSKSLTSKSQRMLKKKNAGVNNELKAQVVLKRGGNAMPLTGKIMPIQGPMIWKLVNSSQLEASNASNMPSNITMEQLKNNATLKFTDEQKVMITFSQAGEDSKLSTVKTIIANVASNSKPSPKNSSGVRTHQAVLMPVNSLKENGTDLASGNMSKYAVKALRSAAKKAPNLSNYRIIPISSIMPPTSVADSLHNVVTTKSKPVSRSGTDKVDTSTNTLASSITAKTSASSVKSVANSQIRITTTTTLTTLQSNMKPVGATNNRTQAQTQNIAPISKVLINQVATSTNTSQQSRTLVIKQASTPQQVFSFLPTTGNSSIPTFQLVPNYTAPTTQGTKNQNSQFIRPLILAPRFAAPRVSSTTTTTTTSTVASSTSKPVELNTSGMRTVLLTTGALNAAINGGGSAFQLTLSPNNKSLVTGAIPLLLTAQKQSPDNKGITKNVKLNFGSAPCATNSSAAPKQSQAKLIQSQAPMQVLTAPVPSTQPLSMKQIIAPSKPVVVAANSGNTPQQITVISQPNVLNAGLQIQIVNSKTNSGTAGNIIQAIRGPPCNSPRATDSTDISSNSKTITQKNITVSISPNLKAPKDIVTQLLSANSVLEQFIAQKATPGTSASIPSSSAQVPTSLITKIPLSLLVRSKQSDYARKATSAVMPVAGTETSILIQSQTKPLMSSGLSTLSQSTSSVLQQVPSSQAAVSQAPTSFIVSPAPLTHTVAKTTPLSTMSASLAGTIIKLIPMAAPVAPKRNIEIRPAIAANPPIPYIPPVATAMQTLPKPATPVQVHTRTTSVITPTTNSELKISIKLASFDSGTILRNTRYLNTMSATSNQLAVLTSQNGSQAGLLQGNLPPPTQSVVNLISSIPQAFIAKMQSQTVSSPTATTHPASTATTATTANQLPLAYLTSVPLQIARQPGINQTGQNISVIQSSQRAIYPSPFVTLTQAATVNNSNTIPISGSIMVPITMSNGSMFLSPVYSVASANGASTVTPTPSQANTTIVVSNTKPQLLPKPPPSTKASVAIGSVSKLQKIAPHPVSTITTILRNTRSRSHSSSTITSQSTCTVSVAKSLLAQTAQQASSDTSSKNTAASIRNTRSRSHLSSAPIVSKANTVVVSTPHQAQVVQLESSSITAKANTIATSSQSGSHNETEADIKASQGTDNATNAAISIAPTAESPTKTTVSVVHTVANPVASITSSNTLTQLSQVTSNSETTDSTAEPINTATPTPIPHAAADLTNSLQTLLKTDIKQGSTITINIQGSPVTYALKNGQIFAMPHDQPTKKEEPKSDDRVLSPPKDAVVDNVPKPVCCSNDNVSNPPESVVASAERTPMDNSMAISSSTTGSSSIGSVAAPTESCTSFAKIAPVGSSDGEISNPLKNSTGFEKVSPVCHASGKISVSSKDTITAAVPEPLVSAGQTLVPLKYDPVSNAVTVNHPVSKCGFVSTSNKATLSPQKSIASSKKNIGNLIPPLVPGAKLPISVPKSLLGNRLRKRNSTPGCMTSSEAATSSSSIATTSLANVKAVASSSHVTSTLSSANCSRLSESTQCLATPTATVSSKQSKRSLRSRSTPGYAVSSSSIMAEKSTLSLSSPGQSTSPETPVQAASSLPLIPERSISSLPFIPKQPTPSSLHVVHNGISSPEYLISSQPSETRETTLSLSYLDRNSLTSPEYMISSPPSSRKEHAKVIDSSSKTGQSILASKSGIRLDCSLSQLAISSSSLPGQAVSSPLLSSSLLSPSGLKSHSSLDHRSERLPQHFIEPSSIAPQLLSFAKQDLPISSPSLSHLSREPLDSPEFVISLSSAKPQERPQLSTSSTMIADPRIQSAVSGHVPSVSSSAYNGKALSSFENLVSSSAMFGQSSSAFGNEPFPSLDHLISSASSLPGQAMLSPSASSFDRASSQHVISPSTPSLIFGQPLSTASSSGYNANSSFERLMPSLSPDLITSALPELSETIDENNKQRQAFGFPAANDTISITPYQDNNADGRRRKRKSSAGSDVKFGFECDVCSCKFDTYNLMWRHRKIHLSETFNTANTLVGNQLPRALCPKFAVCQTCNQWFENNADLERHHLVDNPCKKMNNGSGNSNNHIENNNKSSKKPPNYSQNSTQFAENSSKLSEISKSIQNNVFQDVIQPATNETVGLPSSNELSYQSPLEVLASLNSCENSSTPHSIVHSSYNNSSNRIDPVVIDNPEVARKPEVIHNAEVNHNLEVIHNPEITPNPEVNHNQGSMDIELIGDILSHFDYEEPNQVFSDVNAMDTKIDIKPVRKHRRTSSKSGSSKGSQSRRNSTPSKNCAMQKRGKRRSRVTISDDEDGFEDTGLDLDGEFIATGKLYGEFTCSRCDRGFQNEEELDEHNEMFHDSLRYNFRERKSYSMEYLDDFEDEFE